MGTSNRKGISPNSEHDTVTQNNEKSDITNTTTEKWVHHGKQTQILNRNSEHDTVTQNNEKSDITNTTTEKWVHHGKQTQILNRNSEHDTVTQNNEKSDITNTTTVHHGKQLTQILNSSTGDRQTSENKDGENHQKEDKNRNKQKQCHSPFPNSVQNYEKPENESFMEYKTERAKPVEDYPDVDEVDIESHKRAKPVEDYPDVDEVDIESHKRNSVTQSDNKKKKDKKKKKDHQFELTPDQNKNTDENIDSSPDEQIKPNKKKERTSVNILKNDNESIKCMSAEVEKLVNHCKSGTDFQQVENDSRNHCPKKFTKQLKYVEEYISQLRSEKNEYICRNTDENIDSSPDEPIKPNKKKQRTSVNILKNDNESIKCMSAEVEKLVNHCKSGTDFQQVENDSRNQCPKKFTKQLKYVEEYISQLRSEKNEYIYRLSNVAGARLLDNNPNIANLGDLNRPTKLADSFSKLYDDEWTDAYEMLVKKNVHPETAIYHLYGTLKAVFETCKQKSDIQLNGMAEHLFLISNPSSEQLQTMLTSYTFEHKKLIDLRKETAEDAIYTIQQTIRKDGIFEQNTGVSNPVLEDRILHQIYYSSYFKKCIELCWLMVIQDPPMYIELEPLEGTKLDKDAYKEYTQSGRTIQYVVWPALYLFCNDKRGPLMSKGVVQPM